MRFPQGWLPLTDDLATKLEAELRRELPRGHLLYDRPVRALAKRADRDDVLFRSIGEEAVYCVHLTWTMERDASWPWTEEFKDAADFLERWRREELDESIEGAG
jgi:hypothetical protein